MANMESGGASNPKMIKATGAGTDLDPFLIELALTSSQLTQLTSGILSALASLPAHYERSRMWKNKDSNTAEGRRTLVSPDRITVNINNVGYVKQVEQELDLNVAATWDTIVGTNYSVAANRAGKDFFVYACQPVSGSIPVFLISAASTFPAGYTALTSRKIAQFHCECLSVGTIAGHSLTEYLTGDILPRSIQDLKHRPNGNREFKNGVVWGGITDFDNLNYAPVWKAIYMASGTSNNVASVFGAVASINRDWNSFVSDFGLVGCRMMRDYEFQVLATGIEEEVNVTGSVSPITTGGHVSTTGRRMISNIGSEDDTGVWWQWLDEQSYRLDGVANHTHQVTVSGDPQTVTSGGPSVDVAPAWTWYNLPGAVGSLYRQGTYGDVKLLAGGYWADATRAGSRARNAFYFRWSAGSSIGGRFVAD